MISNEDEFLGKTKRTEAGGKCDLRCLINDTIVKLATREDGAMTRQK